MNNKLIKKIFLIDINIIKNLKAGNRRLGNLINKHNTLVSIWLPVIESIRHYQDIEKVKETLLENKKILDRNLTKANHDADYFIENDDLLENIFNSIKNDSILHKYENFLEKASSCIVDQKKCREIPAQIQELKAIANQYKIDYGHPLFILTLAIVLGNDEYRKLLKPKKNTNIYTLVNSISDVLVLSRFEIIKNIMRKNNNRTLYPTLKFLTLDKALEQFLKNFKIQTSFFLNRNHIQITYNISLKNFPKLAKCNNKKEILKELDEVDSGFKKLLTSSTR